MPQSLTFGFELILLMREVNNFTLRLRTLLCKAPALFFSRRLFIRNPVKLSLKPSVGVDQLPLLFSNRRQVVGQMLPLFRRLRPCVGQFMDLQRELIDLQAELLILAYKFSPRCLDTFAFTELPACNREFHTAV